MLAQFVHVLYSIVDRMYIGNIADVGELALAGVGVCGPVITLISSVASLIGIGGAPLMSIRLGEKNLPKAKAILANSFLMLCVLSLLLTVGLFFIKRPMLLFFGASQATISFANQYFSVYLIGTLFALLATGMNQFIICQGFAKIAMFSVVIGAVSNIVLDPLFIFVFHLGVSGAAIATVLSQLASCCFVLAFLFGQRPMVSIGFGGYSWKIMRRILAVGFTPFAIIAADNVMIIAMNMILQRYGGHTQGDLLVTCATIAQSFMLIVTMPLGGITGGTQAILGFNYGARQVDRVKVAQRKIFLLCLIYTACMTAAAWLCGQWFVRLFTNDAAVMEKAPVGDPRVHPVPAAAGVTIRNCRWIYRHRSGALLSSPVVLEKDHLFCRAVCFPGDLGSPSRLFCGTCFRLFGAFGLHPCVSGSDETSAGKTAGTASREGWMTGLRICHAGQAPSNSFEVGNTHCKNRTIWKKDWRNPPVLFPY